MTAPGFGHAVPHQYHSIPHFALAAASYSSLVVSSSATGNEFGQIELSDFLQTSRLSGVRMPVSRSQPSRSSDSTTFRLPTFAPTGAELLFLKPRGIGSFNHDCAGAGPVRGSHSRILPHSAAPQTVILRPPRRSRSSTTRREVWR